MKKTLASITVALLAVCASHGQGTLFFQNWTPTGTPPIQRIFDTDTTTPLAGAQYVAELWLVGGASPLSVSGFLGGGALNSIATVAVPGVADGALANLFVRVWDNTTGADYASATKRGQSANFAITLAAASSPNQPYLITTGGNNVPFQSFNLQVVPEPSVIALGALGIGMVFLRRRKAA